MQQDIIRIVITILLTWGLYALNEAINTIPKLKNILAIIIIVVGCLFLINPVVDILSIALNSTGR